MRNPWIDLPATAPFVLPCDRQSIAAFNNKAKSEHKIHLEVLPAPFVGSPEVNIILLNLNPGFSQRNKEYQENTYYCKAVRANLMHAKQDYPFYVLDPEISTNPGNYWWSRKLKPLIDRYGLNKVASEICVVEYFPYHSEHFAGNLFVPSQAYSWYLVQEALKRNALIIQMRSRSIWQRAIPDLARYWNYYVLNSPQNTIISRTNCPDGFPEILKILGA